MPTLEAYAPNQVWTWDITKVAGELPGLFYFVFVIIDLFSRMVVGWMVADTENAKLAGHLISSTMKLHDIPAGTLTIHSDRGAPMTARSMSQLLQALGVEQSLSRPRVSNDNPFVESFFKTAKYQPEYPSRFASPIHVRAWFQEYFDWYCHHHHHQGLALFTPADVFHGRVPDVAATRQAALDAAYALHPERFVRGRPCVRLPPTRVPAFTSTFASTTRSPSQIGPSTMKRELHKLLPDLAPVRVAERAAQRALARRLEHVATRRAWRLALAVGVLHVAVTWQPVRARFSAVEVPHAYATRTADDDVATLPP